MRIALNNAQNMLNELGIKGVKFLFKKQALDKPMSELESNLAGVLQRFHAGEATRHSGLPSEELTKIG